MDQLASQLTVRRHKQVGDKPRALESMRRVRRDRDRCA